MKRICLGFLLFVALAVFVSCTDGGGGDESYVYYFAADGNAENGEVVLHVLMTKNEKKKEGSSKEPFTESYAGKDIKEAFTLFFDSHKDAYTGTVKEYAISEALGEKALDSFKVYLTNSPSLPAKKETVVIGDVNGYIQEKLTEQSK